MILMNQIFLHFFSKKSVYIKEYKKEARAFIKFYTSRLVKSSICGKEYYNANLYKNLLSDKDPFLSNNNLFVKEIIKDLTKLECQSNDWHLEDSIKSFSLENAIGITYWSVLFLGEYLSKRFPNEKFLIFGDIQCETTKRSKKLLPISIIRFYKAREYEKHWLEHNLDLYTHNAIIAYTINCVF